MSAIPYKDIAEAVRKVCSDISNEDENKIIERLNTRCEMNIIEELKQSLKTSTDTSEKCRQSEKLYWLYRQVKDYPQQFEVAFLLEANKLQKSVIDELVENSN